MKSHGTNIPAIKQEKQITRELNEFLKLPMVRKTFLLHFPPVRGWKPKRIFIASENKFLNGEMKTHDVDMFEFATDVPAGLLNVSYHYECQLKGDTFFNSMIGSIGSPPLERSYRCQLNSCSVQRDTWVTTGWKLNDPHSFDAAHLADLLYHCPSACSIIDACSQIESLCFKKLPIMQALHVLQTLATHLPSSRDLSKLLFLVVIGNILSEPRIIIKEKPFDNKIAENILLALRHFEVQDLPMGIRERVFSVLQSLCSIAFGSSMNLMQCLNMCYPFIDDTFLLQKCQEYKMDISKTSEESTEVVFELFGKLSDKSFRNSSEKALKVLDLLLRHLPFNMTLDVISRMRCSKSYFTSDLEHLSYCTVEIRIEKQLRDVTKNRDLKGLTDLWINLMDNERSEEKLKPRFEEALICILGSYRSTADVDLPAVVVEFILRYNFFKEDSKKEKLMDLVTESPNHEILELFVILSQVPEMTDQYLLVSSHRFQRFCLRYITENSGVLADRNTAFKKLFMRICKIWGLLSVTQNTEHKDIVVHIWKSELEKYRLKDIVLQLKLVDEMSGSSPTISDALIELIKESLKESSESAEDVMSYLPQDHGYSIIESRLAADLVCALINTFGGLAAKSSDFDNFLMLVSHYKFWMMVFLSTGAFKETIEENCMYTTALHCISNMVNLFKEHEVHIGFVRTLEKDQQTTLSAKKLLQLQCNMIDVNQFWSEALMSFKEIKHNILDVKNVMAQVKRNSSFLPDGFDSVYKRVEDCEKRLSSGLMKASECKNEQLIWKDVECLPDICQQIKHAVSSSVFWNVSCDKVKSEYLLKLNEGVIDDPITSLCDLFQEKRVVDEHEEKNCMLYMNVLQTLGPTSYGNKWNELLQNENFRLEEVFRMFGTSPNISDEIQIAKKYLHIVVDSEIEECLKRIFSSETVKQTVDAMKKIVSVFKIDWQNDKIFATSITSFQQLLIGTAEEYTFSEVKVALNTVFSLVQNLSEDTVNIMLALGKATTLITFLRTIVDEDIKNLIDAVEDISEQQVRESTVSALIEVKQFLHPLLLQSEMNCQDFFQTLEKQTKSSRANSASLPPKIEDCIQNLHNLKSLYNGVANRGEQTKEMIKNIIQKGTYHFHLNRAKRIATFEAFYTQNRLKETRKRSTLIDLRSRALLLVNTERKSMHDARFNRNELLIFIESIDLCLDIAGILFSLYASGHTGYMIIKETARPVELLTKKKDLKSTLDLWLRDVNAERDCHYLMNFIQGNHIHLLFKYLEENRENINTVQTILKFIHPSMQAISLQEAYNKEKKSSNDWSNRQMLHCMGFALHSSFEGLAMFQRPTETQQIKNLNSIVQSSRLTVAQLDQESQHTIRTMLALYMNTTQKLPEPNHIVFCTRETTWTELDLLIKRCLGAFDFYETKVLFCIANVEMLPNELQFSLVETLRHLRRDIKFYLTVICRGSRNHPFIDELSDCVKSVSPVTDKTIRDLFKEHCENVETVTSDFSGLGKTSYITSMAHKRNKGIATLHISGTVSKSQLVERINTLNVKGYQVLHIDLGNVDCPSELDTFLFELVVLRYVAAGNVSVSLRTSDVNIEIANTINNTLVNALQTAVLFQRVNIKWNGIEGLIVSRELNSPVQVVCNYLKCLDNGTLDKKDICFSKDSPRPLTEKECKALLRRYLSREIESSFPVLFTFIHVVADQLKKMNQSSFFKVSRLVDMVGSKVELTIKSKLVEAIIQVSKDFATRSVNVCREGQIATMETDDLVGSDFAACVTGRVEGMIRWEDSNHLVFVFHNQNIHTLSALYRNLSKVPAEIRNLFESQMKKEMEDFNELDQEKLQILLQKVARENPLPLRKTYLNDLSKNYALTADNLLKMVLIVLRIKANIPVIVMGETGCGKTSLIRYLSQICEVDIDVLNIHAGVKEEDILECVLTNNKKALSDIHNDKWLFLDEINTSDSIGLISDIICHHRCLGEELSPNLVVLGACNPYKLRTSKAISSAGLEGKVKSDELSRLVYRVLPLPEIMVDYVWDFGSLNEKDEETYIHRMIADVFQDHESYHELFTSLLAVSQSFVRRKEESSYSVSLRDIQRCRTLTKWFLSVLPKKRLHQYATSNSCNVEIKSMILSLAHYS